MNNSEKMREWMFPAILILFILQVMLLPVVIGLTYAVPAERPEHILTYRTGSLVGIRLPRCARMARRIFHSLKRCIRM